MQTSCRILNPLSMDLGSRKWAVFTPCKGSLTIVFCSVEWDKPDDLQTLGQGMQHNLGIVI